MKIKCEERLLKCGDCEAETPWYTHAFITLLLNSRQPAESVHTNGGVHIVATVLHNMLVLVIL